DSFAECLLADRAAHGGRRAVRPDAAGDRGALPAPAVGGGPGHLLLPAGRDLFTLFRGRPFLGTRAGADNGRAGHRQFGAFTPAGPPGSAGTVACGAERA